MPRPRFQPRYVAQKNAIIHDSALGPGIFKICPACGRWFVLRLERVEPHPAFEEVRTFCCTACGERREFIASRPTYTL